MGGPTVIALGQPGGGYIDGTTQVISGEVPAPISPRKILVADFNGDGWPDIFIADFGLDYRPSPEAITGYCCPTARAIWFTRAHWLPLIR